MRSSDAEGNVAEVVTNGDEELKNRGAEIIDLVQLPPRARPRPFAELDFEEVFEARGLDCPDYNACLSFVAHVRWQGFSCRQCPKFHSRLSAHAQVDEGDHNEQLASVIPLV